MLNRYNESTRKYIETFMQCDPENSIVNTVVVLSLNGAFGDITPQWMQYRIGDDRINITPLLGLYWIYDLNGVYNNLKYDVSQLKNTKDPCEIVKLLHFAQ